MNSQRLHSYQSRSHVGDLFGFAMLFGAAILMPALILLEVL
jgi:hypothetical protein